MAEDRISNSGRQRQVVNGAKANVERGKKIDRNKVGEKVNALKGIIKKK